MINAIEGNTEQITDVSDSTTLPTNVIMAREKVQKLLTDENAVRSLF